MDHQQTSNELFDCNLRAGWIVHLAAAGDCISPLVRAAFVEAEHDIWQAMGWEPAPGMVLEQALAECVAGGRGGFVVEMQAITPRNVRGPAGRVAWDGSWSDYQTRWFYGDDLADVYSQAQAWWAESLEERRLGAVG